MGLEDILNDALLAHASDVHIAPNMPPKFRVDGALEPAKNYPVLSADETKNLLYELMTEEKRQEFEKELVVDIAVYFPKLGNFRVSILHQINGIEAVFRIVPDQVPTFATLNLPNVLKKLLIMPNGIVIITGPTGSGKSSTLAAMIDYINTYRSGHIITIEDPIEYIHSNKKSTITQLQVGRETTSFAAALRASLRQDPNVIMLGELRDLDSMRLALRAAETGHLVLTTMHASTAALSVNRIIDMFPMKERTVATSILSETIQGIICQTLVRKIPSGRAAAFEVMLATPAIRHLIARGRHHHIESAIQTGGEHGMFTLENDLLNLAKRGIISERTAQAEIASRDTFKYFNFDVLKKD